MQPHDRDFLSMTKTLDKEALLILADRAIAACKGVLDEIRENDIGDAYDYLGGMNDVESARDAILRYKGYLITGQK